MRKIFVKMLDILDAINRARVAAHFTRMGRNDLARAVMLKDDAKV